MATTTIQLTVGTFSLSGSNINLPVQHVIQLTTGDFALTGYILTGAFVQRVIELLTGYYSAVFFGVTMDGFVLPPDTSEVVVTPEPEPSSGPQDIAGRSPSWRNPGPATGGTAWRTPLPRGGAWRHN